MFEEVEVLTHSSIKITGKKIIYFDPFEIQEESHDADLILITHDHHDHYSPEDIGKIAGTDTWLRNCRKISTHIAQDISSRL